MTLGFLTGVIGLARDFDPNKIPSNDFVHVDPPESIYRRTDYLVNSRMAIAFGLARTWNYGVTWELAARRGLPPLDRAPNYSPIVLAPSTLPDKAGR